jgi:FKBP-type peptidyl-prolyl cis-trans isomerase SlyD
LQAAFIVNIAKDAVVSLEVEIWDLFGNQLESSAEPLSYLHGGYDEIFPAVEAALEGKQEGDSLEVDLEPEDAFGDYDDELVHLASREAFPETLEVGMQFEGIPGEDDDDDSIYTVTEIADGKVVLDGNHPLSGIAIRFRCRVVGVRPATDEEIERGQPDEADDSPVRVLH